MFPSKYFIRSEIQWAFNLIHTEFNQVKENNRRYIDMNLSLQSRRSTMSLTLLAEIQTNKK